MVRLLLRRGANLELAKLGGSRALHRAANGGQAACVELLLEGGAELEALRICPAHCFFSFCFAVAW